MKHSERLELFENVRARYSVFLTSVLWKLTADREVFAEAMQYALFGIWQHVEKLKDETATSYIYRVALTANSKAWRNRVGRNGEIPNDPIDPAEDADERVGRGEAGGVGRGEHARGRGET